MKGLTRPYPRDRDLSPETFTNKTETGDLTAETENET